MDNHTLKEWKEIVDKGLYLGSDILRDWGRSELILEGRIAELESNLDYPHEEIADMQTKITELQAVVDRLADKKYMHNKPNSDYLKEFEARIDLAAKHATK